MIISRQAGVSLLEVLIALLVLAVGILGVMALQTKSLALVQETYWRGQAVSLAYDLGDRMRANNTDLLSDYAISMGAGAPQDDNLAKGDLADWLEDLDAALPNGNGHVAINSGQATITVQWNASPRLDGTLQSFVTEVIP